jgi:ubiquinone/menaquinone biosynthesis C-methylase UbiE
MKGLTYDAGAAAYDAFTGRWSIAFAGALLEAARVRAGHTLLEVAAGTGGLTVMAAAAVGAAGHVIATDLSEPMLRVAASKVAALPVNLVVMDGQQLGVRDRACDVLICQLGLMFFPDREAGLREFRRVLREHGRLGVQTWSSPDRVPFFGLLSDALSRYLPNERSALYSPAALSDPDHLERLLTTAGFDEVSIVKETRKVAFGSFDEYWGAIEAGGGRMGQFYLALRTAERRAVQAEVRERMAQFQAGRRLILKAEALIATGRNAGK